MVLLDTTVLSVAEPDLARSFGGGVTGLQWTVTGYTLVFGAALLTAGSAADRYGAHRVFRVAVAAFGLGSLLSALAPSLWALVGLRAPGVPGALVAGAAVNFAMSGVLFVLPLLFQQALGLTPGQIGAALLPMTLPFAVNPLLTGRIVARSGPRPPVLAGLGLLAAGGVAFGAAVWAGASYPFLLAGLVATGFGVSFALPALATLIVTAAPEGTAGMAGGLLNAARQCGATIGVAVTGAFVTVGVPDQGHHGAAYALVMPAVVCAAAAVAVARRRAG
ncbi:MFS transporter [Microbispora hainanensis]|uniref:MFS transporter n=2 Tax=Microbispora hainanensis TaxID=568844 RepID=A0A544YHB7_9ACTN|nr:MFS transporter [Microbispora hainanensis]